MGRPRLVSDEQILDAVRESVREWGPRVSLNEVAARIGVSQPALLKRFGSREQLMLSALVRPGPPPWLAVVDAGPDARPLREQLEDVVARIARDMEEHLPSLSALRESGIPHQKFIASMKPSPPVLALKTLTAWLKRAQARGLIASRGLSHENVAAALMSSVIARAQIQHLLNNTWTKSGTREFVRDVTEMFVRVLTPSKDVTK